MIGQQDVPFSPPDVLPSLDMKSFSHQREYSYRPESHQVPDPFLPPQVCLYQDKKYNYGSIGIED